MKGPKAAKGEMPALSDPVVLPPDNRVRPVLAHVILVAALVTGDVLGGSVHDSPPKGEVA